MSLSADTASEVLPAGAGYAGRSRRFGFWAVAFAFMVLSAFSTAPSPLYGLYEQRDGLSSLTVTAVYGVYAAGIVVSLLLVGHVSDWYGRRPVLIPALAVALVAAILFCVWQSLPGLFVERILSGVAVGGAVATATAYLADTDEIGGAPSRKAQVVATTANLGGLGIGALLSGVLAQYVTDKLTISYIVLIAALAVGVVAVFLAPESRVGSRPRPRFRPQRLGLPAKHRSEVIAAIAGIFRLLAKLCGFGVAGASRR